MNSMDRQEHDDLYDTGTTIINLDDPPTWLNVRANCPACESLTGDQVPVDDHEAVQIDRASGEIFACLPDRDAQWQELKTDDLSHTWQ